MSTTTIAPSIFAADANRFWTRYRVRLQLREKIMGGIPVQPDVIEAWIRKNMGLSTADELRLQMVRTLIELGADLRTDETDAEKIFAASKGLADQFQTNAFKQNGQGLYIEGRNIKAMLKECINALFAGDEQWGTTRKGPKNFTAEHIFPAEDQIPLGVDQASGTDLIIGHIPTPQGPRSTLTYVQYVERPVIEFTLMLDPRAEEQLTDDHWRQFWLHAQENGLGAMRSQGHGRFNVIEWTRLPVENPFPKAKRAEPQPKPKKAERR